MTTEPELREALAQALRATRWNHNDTDFYDVKARERADRILADPRVRDALDALRTPAEPGLREALEAAAKIGCIRQFWGARRPCAEYDDGRELCAPCSARAALATPIDPTS